MKNALLIYFFILCFGLHAAAQEPAYLHYDVADGLPSSLVYCALQDSKGFMWLGTDKGLVRFDGSRFKVFGIKDGLPDLEVLSLFEDMEGRIWMSCLQNKPVFLLNGEIHTAENDPMLSKMNMTSGVYSFFIDEDETLWIAGDPYKFCKVKKQTTTCFDVPKTLKNGTPFGRPYGPSIRLFHKVEGTVLGLGNEAILFFDQEGRYAEKIILLKDYVQGELAFNDVFAVGNKLIFSYQNRLVVVEIGNCEITSLSELKDSHFGRVRIDKDGKTAWVCSQADGVQGMQFTGSTMTQTAHLLPGKRTTDVIKDKEGGYWLGTFNEGIYYLPKNAPTTYTKANSPHLFSDDIFSLSSYKDGTLLLGDDAGILYEVKDGVWRFNDFDQSMGRNRILQIIPMGEADWIAVTDRGLFSKTSGRINVFKGDGAPKSLIINGDEMWLGTSNFLSYKHARVDTSQRVEMHRTTTLCLDKQGNLWSGGFGGLMSQATGFKSAGTGFSRLLSGRISDIKNTSGNQGIWVASPAFGLLKLDIDKGKVKRVEVINDSLTIPIENINTIFQGQDDRVWLATNSGVYSVNGKYDVSKFVERNGLVSDNVNAVYVIGDTLFAATTAGLSVIPLSNGAKDILDFKSLFSEVGYSLDSKNKTIDLLNALDTGHEITLPAKMTLLEVHMTGLTFNHRNNLSFEFKIGHHFLPVGLLTWENFFLSLRDLGTNEPNTIILQDYKYSFGANTPPGKYHLSTTAILPNGERSKHSDSLSLIVKPFWWQVLWVHLALASLVAYGISRLVKDREKLLKIQNVNSELQLQAIRAQMNPHFVGNSINAIQQFFYPPDPVKASEYISIFSDLLRRTMYFSETDFITFAEELAYVNDYLKMINLRFGNRFSYEITGVETISEDTIFPSMLLQPILENATIHGLASIGPSMLSICFHKKDGRINCTVTDNGVGIEVSRDRKAKAGGTNRISKGIQLLERKVETLNQLYQKDIKIEMLDLGKLGGDSHGTQATISYSL
ncbi:MAG: histidine kinase [Saprospiraceae bacterium]|nr:histidine kinase [Saprospiraceae bacterium]